MSEEPEIVLGFYVPPHPHPLLAPEQNEGWGRLREAFATCRQRIEETDADLLLIYSTVWPASSDIKSRHIRSRYSPM